MEAKFYSSLYEGDSVNGVRLSMGLTGGDFWARVGGCRNIYRGKAATATEGIDFDSVVGVCDVGSKRISVNGQGDLAGQSHLYALRNVNGIGVEEKSLGAVARVGFDESGGIAGKSCNAVSGIVAERFDGSRAKLSWYYSLLGGGALCESFCVYSNGGVGEISFGEDAGSVDFNGGGFYVFDSEVLVDGDWRFCVVAVSLDGVERMSPEIAVDIYADKPAGIGIVEAKIV